MIKIEVTGNSIAEVSDKLLAIGASLQGRVVVNHVGIDQIAAKAEDKPTIGTEAAKRTRKPKTPNAETQAAITEAETGETLKSETLAEAIGELNEPEEPKKLDFDTDVAPVVLRVVKDKGKPVAQEILSQFGVEKASNLDPSRWPELVAALQDAL